MNEECEEHEEEHEPDPDERFDSIRDDFGTEINSVEDAKYYIENYPKMVRYLPEQYKYLLEG